MMGAGSSCSGTQLSSCCSGQLVWRLVWGCVVGSCGVTSSTCQGAAVTALKPWVITSQQDLGPNGTACLMLQP